MSRSKRRSLPALLLLVLLPLLLVCGGSEPVDLVQAAQVIEYMLQPNVLANSAFTAAFPDPSASQFVSYIFSEMGRTEWPVATVRSEEDLEKRENLAPPLTPPGVAFVARRVDPERGRQLVISYDDNHGLVVVEGFEDPARSPVLRRQWVLPDVSPAPGVRAVYQASQRAGMSCQAF